MESKNGAKGLRLGKTVMAHALVGAAYGFYVLHPISLFLVGEFRWNLIVIAFSLPHLMMAVYFTILGFLLGTFHGFYSYDLIRHLERIKILEGLLPICSFCKRIRDDTGVEQGKGRWEQVESFISRRSEVDFSHGVCPPCAVKHYPELFRDPEGKPVTAKELPQVL